MKTGNHQSNGVALKRAGGYLLAGFGHPTRVNALIGMSHVSNEHIELEKLDALKVMENGPDVVTDLGIIRTLPAKPIWQRVVSETTFVTSTVPVYVVRSKANRIDSEELLDIATEQMESGVGLLTIHPTPTRELVELAFKRLVPCTSRGGALVVRDILARPQPYMNVYLDIMDRLLSVAKRTGAVISLGTTFRPANIFDSLDEVQIREIAFQTELAQLIHASGVGVVIEGPGHCRPGDIYRVSSLLRQAHTPIMALGPLPLDSAIGMDHIAAAIGATLLGLQGCAHILSTVTRDEHTGGVPNLQSILEAVVAARIAAKVIDLELIGGDQDEREVATLRAAVKSCIAGQAFPACARCAEACPLAVYDDGNT